MDVNARYKTQSSVYDCPMLGKLTDKRIKHYQRKGHYEQSIPALRNKPKSKHQQSRARNTMLMSLLDGLV